MYTDEEFEKLEKEEREITYESLAVMFLILSNTKNDLERELRDFYQKYGTDGIITYQEAQKWVSEKDRRRRMTLLFMLIGSSFTSGLKKMSPEFESFLTEVVKLEGDFFNVDVDPFDLIYTKWGIDGLNWLDRLTEDVNLWTKYVMKDVKQSFLRKDHIDDVIKQLNKRFDTMERVLERLGITESTAMGTMARRQIFKELGISKYKFYTRADERTCEECGGLHGTVFPISAYEVGTTASPLHPRCRCWEVPVVD